VVLRRPVLFIGVVALLTAFFMAFLPQVSFRTSIDDLIIEDHPENRAYERHMDEFGSDEMIRIVVRAGDVYAPAAFEAIRRLSRASAELAGVKDVISLPGIKGDLDPSGGWTLGEFQSRVDPIVLFDRNLVSEDGGSTTINLILEAGADKEEIIRKLDDLLITAAEPLSVYQIGIPVISDALTRYAERDFLVLPPLTLVAIAGILLVLYRNFYLLLMPLATVLIALAWTLGISGILGISISLVTMVVPVFVIAVGTAYCLHLCSHYVSNAPSGGDRMEVVRKTMRSISLPTVLAGVTTLAGIGSLWVNRISAIREFALLACLGMLSLLILLFVFFPAVLVLIPLPRKREKKPALTDRAVKRVLEGIVRINTRHPGKALAGMGLLVAVFGSGIFLLRVETNPVQFFKKDTPVSRRFHDIYQDMSGSFPAQVVVRGNAESFFEDPKNTAVLEEVQDFLDRLPGVDKSVSFADYVKLVHYVSNGYDPKLYRLPEEDFELRMLINNFKSILGEEMLARFMDREFSAANILLLTHLSSTREFRGLREKILEFGRDALPPGMSVEVTGIGMVISASSQAIAAGQIKSLSLSLSIVFLIMVVLFLSVRVGLIAILPNCVPIVVSFGFMGFSGIELSVATSLIACIVIGLAVDDTVHYLVRYNHEFRNGLNKERALRASVLGVGRPVIYTTLTMSVGFSFLMFSHFQPTAVFGLLMVLTMVTALAADLILLPSLMLRVELVTAWDLLKVIPYMGGISAGTAHELNQPLNAIKMGSEFLRIMVRQGADVSREQLASVAAEISSQVDRASAVIGRLRSFQGAPREGTGQVDVNDAVRACLSVLENQLRVDDIDVRVELADDLPAVEAHAGRLTQVIFNLVTNAAEAVENASARDPSSPRAIEIRTARDAGRVTILIQDTGPGVPRHLRERIFEPFYTTKTSGDGKGLGLSISREILRDCGGRVEVKKGSAGGAAFEVSLPARGRESAEGGNVKGPGGDRAEEDTDR